VVASIWLLIPSLVSAKIPNDPKMDSIPWQHKKINAAKAWNKTTGSDSVVIAVIDNGFDHLHPDLIQNTWRNIDEIPGNNTDDDNNGYVDDVWGWNFEVEDYNKDGKIDDQEKRGNNKPRPKVDNLREVSEKTVHHGTIVAGLTGAVGDNKIAGAGMNWDVELMNLKVVDNDGAGRMKNISRAIKYAVDNGADIITFSLVGDLNQERTEEIKRLVDYAYENDVAMFAAAGNKGQNLQEKPMQPVCADQSLEGKVEKVIGVSAIKKSTRLARFSNWGLGCIDITAPGVNMSSTVIYNPNSGLNKKYDGSWSGTSFAVPLVSGTAGLIKSLHSDWGPKKIYDTILNNVFNSKGSDNQVYKKLFGNGLLQAGKAVEEAWNLASADLDIKGLVALDSNGNIRENAFVDLAADMDLPFENIKGEIKKATRIKGHTLLVVEKEGELYVNHYQKKEKKLKSNSLPLDLNKEERVKKIEAGDIDNDGQIEIILMVTDNNGQTRILSFSIENKAVLQRSYKDELKSITVIHGLSEDKLVGLFKTEQKYYLSFLNSVLTQQRKISLNFNGDKLDSGDIDGDKKGELIISSYKNSSPLLSYLEQNGTIKRRFYAYDSSYRGSFKTLLGDINSDKKDEIITIPASSHEIKVWTDKVKVIKTITSFGLEKEILPLISTK